MGGSFKSKRPSVIYSRSALLLDGSPDTHPVGRMVVYERLKICPATSPLGEGLCAGGTRV